MLSASLPGCFGGGAVQHPFQQRVLRSVIEVLGFAEEAGREAVAAAVATLDEHRAEAGRLEQAREAAKEALADSVNQFEEQAAAFEEAVAALHD